MARPELEDLLSAWRADSVPQSRPQARGSEGTLAVAAALRHVAERRRRQQRLRRTAVFLSIAAGVFGVALGGWFGYEALAPIADGGALVEPRVHVDRSVGEVAVTDGVGRPVDADAAVNLVEGDGLRTEQGSARLGFPSGALAEVSARSALRITRTRSSESLFLARGRVDVEVPTLDKERGFSVETPDARVTVHGTRFSVNVDATSDGPQTRVRVDHGIVSVQHAGREVRLTAGQVWPSPPNSVLDPPSMGPQEPLSTADGGALVEEPRDKRRKASRLKRVARGERRDAPDAELESRELWEQNRRFARAMGLKKNGATRAALDELTELLRRYPASPLTQELRVERLRLLQSLGLKRQAVQEARAYLRDFPGGYAEREAQELVAEQP